MNYRRYRTMDELIAAAVKVNNTSDDVEIMATCVGELIDTLRELLGATKGLGVQLPDQSWCWCGHGLGDGETHEGYCVTVRAVLDSESSSMSRTPDEIVKEAKERLDGITPGEWKCWNGWGPAADGLMRVARIGPSDPDAWRSLQTRFESEDISGTKADMEFIARAPTLVRDLLTALEVAESAHAVTQREREQLRATIEQMHQGAVPPTIATDDSYREPYVHGYRHALSDVLKLWSSPASLSPGQKRTEQEEKKAQLTWTLSLTVS